MQLSSKDKTILVLADVHQEIDKLKYILKKESYDVVVHLGDFFDNHYNDTKIELEKTCLFVKEYIFRDNFFTLHSNHDIQYLYSHNMNVRCGGYEDWKSNVITEILGSKLGEIKNRYHWYLWIDDFLCTHAGVHPYHFPPYLELNKRSLNSWLDTQSNYAEANLEAISGHWFYMAGEARFGNMAFGGILWLDFKHEFEPIIGLNQLVGHTNGKSIRPHHTDGNLNPNDWDNICLDCRLNEYMLIRNGKIEIKSYSDL